MEEIGNPKVRAPQEPVAKGAMAEIKTLIKHPMESGLRKDKESGEIIPAHYIESVKVEYMGKTIIDSEWSAAVSKNPYFSFTIKAVESGPIKVTWKDNKGQSFSAEAALQVK
ncbi:MAG: thiosulfate oxidation carrier complex protein SoxZ [Magnetococcales bacterium]|nr:thiosulfate oxidation carrier complex protein SoxZ [Magnetococcales bacterium]